MKDKAKYNIAKELRKNTKNIFVQELKKLLAYIISFNRSTLTFDYK